jgi:hypothetical protein
MSIGSRRLLLISLLGCAPFVATASGFNFRPMEGVEPSSQPLAPGWRVDPQQAQAQGSKGEQSNTFQFQPQTQRPPVVHSPAEGRPASAMHYNFAPDEQSAASAPPPPLPEPIKADALAPSGMAFPSPQQPMTGQAPPGVGFAGPQQPMTGQVPFGSQSQHPAGVPPSPLPPPLRLEGRYIDGPNSHVDKRFPFRPLDDERGTGTKIDASRMNTQSADDHGRGFTHQHQPQGLAYPPPMPGYGPRRYDRYNNSPSFNGFRFPFNNGSFPFDFR